MLFTGQYPHANGVLGNVNSTTVQYENYAPGNRGVLLRRLASSRLQSGVPGQTTPRPTQ